MRCWRNFGGHSRASWRTIRKPCTASGFNITVPQPTPPKKPRFGCGRASESAWCELLSLAPGRPAPWTWFHRTPCYGGHLKFYVYWTNPRSLQDRQEAMKSFMRLVSPSVCRAPEEAVLCRASYTWSEKWFITNMCPARLSQVTPWGESPLKQNIFEQAFIWRAIRHSSPNTTRNVKLLNSSDFSETPGIKVSVVGQCTGRLPKIIWFVFLAWIEGTLSGRMHFVFSYF